MTELDSISCNAILIRRIIEFPGISFGTDEPHIRRRPGYILFTISKGPAVGFHTNHDNVF